jgi:hypothetical protein
MGITKESGDILLMNPENETIKVASIQHGISFSKTLKHRKVVRVTIYSLDGALSDEFYFAPGEKDWEVLFQHIQTRDIRPELFRLILTYFADEKNYNPVTFIDHIIQFYFIDELNHAFPNKIVPGNYA